MNERDRNTILSEGKWDENISWQFVVSDEVPANELCTAVSCVVTYQGKLVIIRNARGWEFPAGHIEAGETPKEAVIREVAEETAAQIANPTVFGYKKLTASIPVEHRDQTGTFYPFPDSYVVYHYAEASEFLTQPLAADISETKVVSLAQASELLAANGQYDNVIEYLVQQGLITVF